MTTQPSFALANGALRMNPFIGGTALLAILALSLPTRHALHARPIEAIGVRE